MIEREPYVILPYAHVERTPGAHLCEVWDLKRRRRVENVVECDAANGWLVRHRLIEGRDMGLEKIEGRFEIRKFARP